MKQKTLGLIQVVLGILFFTKIGFIIAKGVTSYYTFGYNIGKNFHLIFIGIFILITGIYNLKKKK